MALLTEGGASRHAVYKHGPPDGGRGVSPSINMALLTEREAYRHAIYKHRLLTEGRTPNLFHCWGYSPLHLELWIAGALDIIFELANAPNHAQKG